MRTTLAALALLLALFALSFQNQQSTAALIQRCESPLEQKTESALRESYQAWSAGQPHLRVTAPHTLLDDIESGYRQAIILARSGSDTDLLAQVADLQANLQVLADRETLCPENIF